MTEPVPAYIYKAEFVSNHDGDTVTLRLDHGKFPVSKTLTEAVLRVRNLFCAELNQPGGPEAREFTHATLLAGTRLVVQTYKDSFARTVADIWVDGTLLSEIVIKAGHGTAEA